VFFAIGHEDKSDGEFNWSRMGITEYSCSIGVDCLAESFPCRLDQPGFDFGGVKRVTIRFRLDQDCENAIPRLARAGGETTAVSVDKDQTHLVTAKMVGSADHGGYGVYDLLLGELKKGVHTITMTVADDGTGNGGYSWDAISLLTG
jgi:hypothetical protein